MSVMYCRKCSDRISDNTYFCSSCGNYNFLEIDQSEGFTAPVSKGGEYVTSMDPLDSRNSALPFAAKIPDDKNTAISTAMVTSSDVIVPIERDTSINDATIPLQSMAFNTYICESSDNIPPETVPTSLLPAERSFLLEADEYRKDEHDAIAAHPTIPLDMDDARGIIGDEFLLLPNQLADLPPSRAEHQQPTMQRAEHQQPTMQRAGHQQAGNGYTPHFQVGRFVSEPPRQGKRIVSLQNILIGVGTLVLTSVIILLLLPILQPGTPSSPKISLVNATSAFPGGSVTLHGTNFTPGATVTFIADGALLSQANYQTPLAISSQAYIGLGVALFASQLLQSATSSATVRADSTFDAVITIPASWEANTTHDIQATEEGSGQKALTKITVVDHALPTALPTSIPTPNSTSIAKSVKTPEPTPAALASTPTVIPTATPTPVPTATPTATPPCVNTNTAALTFRATAGGSAPSVQSFTISNGNVCGAGNWSVKADASWLTLDQRNGTINANGAVSVNVGIDSANLQAGTYQGHISLSPGTSVVNVNLTVQLSPPCITATPDTLNFTITRGGRLVSQSVTIANGSNCSAGTWSATSDAKWLLARGGGTIGSGGSASATVFILPSLLIVGNYTGHITFSAPGSQPATVTVNLTVDPAIIT